MQGEGPSIIPDPKWRDMALQSRNSTVIWNLDPHFDSSLSFVSTLLPAKKVLQSIVFLGPRSDCFKNYSFGAQCQIWVMTTTALQPTNEHKSTSSVTQTSNIFQPDDQIPALLQDVLVSGGHCFQNRCKTAVPQPLHPRDVCHNSSCAEQGRRSRCSLLGAEAWPQALPVTGGVCT